MKKIGVAIILSALLTLLAIACTEVAMRKVRECSKIVKLELVQEYFLGRFIRIEEPKFRITLANGDTWKIRPENDSWKDIESGTLKVGGDYCQTKTEYEKIN